MAPVCIALIHSQQQSFLPQSTLFLFSSSALIRTIIHLLFISSVALNDVNDLLWTVLESIWILSDTIRHWAPGCSRGSTLLAQHWQIKRDWALCTWMVAHGRQVCVCMCVCVLTHVCLNVCALKHFKPVGYGLKGKDGGSNAMSQNWTYDMQSAFAQDIWVNRKCVCLFAAFVPPELAALSQ